ncbi:aspartyl/asparaginyl beta-hydroxylase domain-containing protein [Streptomyces sp. NPDC023723]|uniref:aspartyl/asparaginyl beta-hydroxylase domain-containing protein n=1 Tax=Streptomyces sp. NPDC023723 TaxID=3154323 RepID=UPI0033DA4BC7
MAVTGEGTATDLHYAALPNAAVLSSHYDEERMRSDLAQFAARSGAVFSASTGWRVLPLYSVAGDPYRTDSGGPSLSGFRRTPWLRHLPYFQEVLDSLPAPIRAARLWAVGPGGKELTLRGDKMGPPWGFCRLHLPIMSEDQTHVMFVGERHSWSPGTLWFVAAWREYAIVNRSRSELVHLIIDLYHTDELEALFPPGTQHLLTGTQSVRLRPQAVLRNPARCKRRFWVPETFANWDRPGLLLYAEAQRVRSARRRIFVPAEIRVTADTPVLYLAGRPFCSLEHVGDAEFRLRGWSDERTLQLTEKEDTPVILCLREGTRTYRIELPANTTSPDAIVTGE